MSLEAMRNELEALYARYNHRRFVQPDPLQFLYAYEDSRDGEIAGLVAASLAYGRVRQILRSVSMVLERMGAKPRRFVRAAAQRSLRRAFAGFKHRWTSGEDLASLLAGLKVVLERYGSLRACFVAGFASEDETVLPALRKLVSQLHAGSDRRRNSLLPSVCSGGACKRLHLYLRWMVRRDKVDPGGWDGVPAGKLIVPVDTHMHRIALAMGWTRRRRADLRAALEITRAFRAIAPADPVRYDFALTRLGIRQDTDMAAFLGRCGAPAVPRCA